MGKEVIFLDIELEEELFKIEPKWFNKENPMESLMCFGFECGNGWFNLVRFLLETAKQCEIREKSDWSGFQVVQVKEKYGQLCFYHYGGTEKYFEIVSTMQMYSSFVCENCGNPGNSNDRGWIKTLCNSCRSK